MCKQIATIAVGFSLAVTAFAGRPLNVDDAEPIAVGDLQVEAGAAYRGEHENNHFDFPLALTYGLVPRVEIGAGLGGVVEDRLETDGEKHSRSGLGDLIIAAKGKFLEEKSFLPAQTLAPAVKFPTASRDRGLGSGKTDYDATWIASKSIAECWNMHLNAGYTWVGMPAGEAAGDIVHYGWAVDWQFYSALQWVAEVFAQKELIGGATTVVQYNTGLRWEAGSGLTLDIAVGSRLSGEAPDFIATAGLTWIGATRR